MYREISLTMMTSSNGNIFRNTGHLCQGPVNSPDKAQWRGAIMFSLNCSWINGWVNNHEAGDLRRHRTHYDVTNGIVSTDTCSLQWRYVGDTTPLINPVNSPHKWPQWGKRFMSWRNYTDFESELCLPTRISANSEHGNERPRSCPVYEGDPSHNYAKQD